MRTAPKIAISLLLTILLFSGLAAAAYAGLFNILETRFYQPAVISSMEKQLASTSEALTAWHTQNIAKFTRFIEADAVKRSLLPNQSAQDIFDRSNLSGSLMADMAGLTGIRIIDAGDTTILPQDDKGTRRIHFSTFKEDILTKQDLQISYVNYGTRSDDLQFKSLSLSDGSKPKLLIESGKDLFLYCFPFYDAYGTWRGTAVFYVAGRAASQYLVSQNLFRISDDLLLLSNADFTVSGALTGMPRTGQDILATAVLNRWTSHDFTTDRIVSTDASGWVLLSSETGEFGYTGQLVMESLFTFPRSVKLLFLAISFLTLFLVIFLFFNLKQDDMLIIRNRIRRFHVQLLNELIDKNEEVHWEEIRKNLSYRKHDISSEIKKSFGNKLNKKHGAEIDALLGKSWDDILSALGQQEIKQTEFSNTDELRRMLEQVLQNNTINLNLKGLPSGTAPAQKAPAKKPAAPKASLEGDGLDEADDLEELDEEIGEAEEVEEISELETEEEAALPEASDEIPAENSEGNGEIEELEEFEEIEEAVAETVVQAAETAEETEETEVREETSEAPAELSEEIEDAEEADELEEIEVAEPEEVEEPEELEEVEEAEEEKPAAPMLPPESKPADNADEDIEELEVLDILEKIPGSLAEQLEEMEGDIPASEPDFEEVEYLDGEWEPHLLEVASDEELIKFIEEKVPDSVLIFNFEEKPALDSGRPHGIEDTELSFDENIVIAGLDFTSLDAAALDAQEAMEVEYIENLLFTQTAQLQDNFEDEPVFEYLEVIGEESPEELIDISEGPLDDTGAVVNTDGLFLVSVNPSPESSKSSDPEFQKLVDSVLQ